MQEERLRTYLADHPRMIGVLFAIGMVVFQTGSVVAVNGTSNPGP